jgi:RNA polymerase sigma-70 factor (ECF subfamily)
MASTAQMQMNDERHEDRDEPAHEGPGMGCAKSRARSRAKSRGESGGESRGQRPAAGSSKRRIQSERPASQRMLDRRLVAAIGRDEPGAFERLDRLYRDRLFAFALKRLRDRAEAEDVVQDVFLQVFRSIGSFEGRSSLLTWMFGIAHHQVCRRLRKRRLEVLAFDEDGAGEVRAELAPTDEQVDAARTLRECSELLETSVSPAQRIVFQLHYGESRSMRDIAAELGKSRQAVKISLFRTRRALGAALADRGIVVTG